MVSSFYLTADSKRIAEDPELGRVRGNDTSTEVPSQGVRKGNGNMKNKARKLVTAMVFAVLASLPLIAMAGMTASQR